ncbi:hypothetical protein ACQ4PT_006600 [Festuca glaucescens]
MEVGKTPELTGFDGRHSAVKMMPAEVTSKLRKSPTQESSLALSVSSDPHSSASLLPRLCCHLLTAPPPATALASVHPAPPASNGSCIAYERATLLSIKASLRDPNTNFSSWQGEDCCRWKGVRCSYKTGHVVKLNLQGKSGDCLKVYPYSGEISYSLVTLQQLRYLDFSCNNFYGAEIPEFIGYLPSLRYLNLSYNRFYGRIPPQIGNLSKLTYLDLKPFGSNNPQFYYLYPGDLQWLSHLSSLKHLDLNHMNLTAVLDWVHEINMLPALRKLYLQYTGLRNRVDFLGQSNLTALEVLDISGNNFNTTICSKLVLELNQPHFTELERLSIPWPYSR